MIQKQGPLMLIKGEFFPTVALAAAKPEFDALTQKDRVELGSAIARSKGVAQDDCNFEFVPY